MISDAVQTTMVNALRDVMVAGVIPGVTYFLTRARARKNRKELGEKLDNIHESNAAAIAACNRTVAALTTQFERGQTGRRHDDTRPAADDAA